MKIRNQKKKIILNVKTKRIMNTKQQNQYEFKSENLSNLDEEKKNFITKKIPEQLQSLYSYTALAPGDFVYFIQNYKDGIRPAIVQSNNLVERDSIISGNISVNVYLQPKDSDTEIIYYNATVTSGNLNIAIKQKAQPMWRRFTNYLNNVSKKTNTQSSIPTNPQSDNQNNTQSGNQNPKIDAGMAEMEKSVHKISSLTLTQEDYLPKGNASYKCHVRKGGKDKSNFIIGFSPTSQTTSTSQTISSSSKQSVDPSAKVPLYDSIIQDLNGQEDEKLKQAFVGAIGIEFILIPKLTHIQESDDEDSEESDDEEDDNLPKVSVDEYDIFVDPVDNCVFNQKAIRTLVRLARKDQQGQTQQGQSQQQKQQRQLTQQNLEVRHLLTNSGGIGIKIRK